MVMLGERTPNISHAAMIATNSKPAAAHNSRGTLRAFSSLGVSGEVMSRKRAADPHSSATAPLSPARDVLHMFS